MKKVHIAAVATAATVAVSGTAAIAAQDTAPAPFESISVNVAPSDAGTKAKPKKGLLNLTFTVDPAAKKTASTITYFVPRNVVLDGRGFKYCTPEIIAQEGEGGCPKGSLVGTGQADVAVGPGPSPAPPFSVNVYAAGRKSLTLALTGAVEVEPFEAQISKAPAPYGQKIVVNIPEGAQKQGGLFVYLTGINTNIKRSATTITRTVRKNGKKRKVKKTVFFASITGCPTDQLHRAGVQLQFVDNDAGAGGTSPLATASSRCTK